MEKLIPYSCVPPVDPITFELSPVMKKAVATVYGSDIVALVRQRQCSHCRQPFTLHATLGTHGCATHPGQYQSATGGWACCGEYQRMRSGRNIGCTPCDHVENAPSFSMTYGRGTCLPLPLFLALPVRNTRAVLGVVPSTAVSRVLRDSDNQDRGEDVEDAIDDYDTVALLAVNERALRTQGTDAAARRHANFGFVPPAFVHGSAASSSVALGYDSPFRLSNGLRLDHFHVLIARTAAAPVLYESRLCLAAASVHAARDHEMDSVQVDDPLPGSLAAIPEWQRAMPF